MDIEREFKTMQNYLNRYKTKKLAFECGCACGYVTRIEMEDNEILVYGIAGWDSKERLIMWVNEHSKKGRDYKYWRQYHILERFN